MVSNRFGKKNRAYLYNHGDVQIPMDTQLDTRKEWIVDAEGRSVLLRGVNLGGSSKVPFTPDGSTYKKTDFTDHRESSFIGRPFPEKEAQEHFTRLKKWGFNCLRFLTTWEAIQHPGPHACDTEYLDYLETMVSLAGEYGFYVFMDIHQDVWSRMTGGDGAPGWLFEKVGLDFTQFDATDAALVMQYRYPQDYPPMCWPHNYQRFAVATMFTLFFGGSDFAPSWSIDGKSAQEYMQEQYINSLIRLVERLKDMNHVLGYDCMNEPSAGYIGVPDLSTPGGMAGQIMPGLQISPFDGMAAAGGFTRHVPVAELKPWGVKTTGEKIINPGEEICWLEGQEDMWRKEGIWEVHEHGPVLLRPGHFSSVNGDPVSFFADYLAPFINRCAEAIRRIDRNALIFIEGEPFHPESLEWTALHRIINASHWYDALTLIKKKFQPWYNYDVSTQKIVFLKKGIQSMYIRQLKQIKQASHTIQSRIPTLIGEFGIPFDMNNKRAYSSGDFSRHVEALSMNYDALDTLLLSATLWNYTADNTNRQGDHWNGEDFSIFSRDQQEDENIWSGGRAIIGFCRPYACKTAGVPIKMSFDRKKGIFTFIYHADPHIHAPTEIYIPPVQFPDGYAVSVDSGTYNIHGDYIHVYATSRECTVIIRRTC